MEEDRSLDVRVVEVRMGSKGDEASFQVEVACLQRILGVELGCAQTAEEEEGVAGTFAVGMAGYEGTKEDLGLMVHRIVEPSY
jgi:hypothetical protein